jgi:DNA-binding NarL/FixJ family response regulator
VILLSGFDLPEYIQRAVDVGAKGYVLKDSASEDLLKAIHVIQQGSRFFSEKIAAIAEQYLVGK